MDNRYRVWTIVAMMVMMVGVVSISAKEAAGMGYIDVEKVFLNYKEAKVFQVKMQKKLEEYQELAKKKQSKIDKVRQKGDEAALKELVADVETELRIEQEDLYRYEAKVKANLERKIRVVADKVKKSYGVDVVLDKRVVFSGGFDLTEFVIQKLN